MKLIKQSFTILDQLDGPVILRKLELAGRTCYKSESRITDISAAHFIRSRLAEHHETIIEHVSVTCKLITNRGVTHELVRHRLASYSQESTRYCNYGGSDVEFIEPVWLPKGDCKIADFHAREEFVAQLHQAEKSYKTLLKHGWSPQFAREVLPNALKTEIIVTANLREWRHIFNLRCSKAAHPQIRALMRSGLFQFYNHIPVIFDDLVEKYIRLEETP